jgi:hypothetical protein
MGGRYWISGVQLGLLKGFVETDSQSPTRPFMQDLLNDIENDQFVGDTGDDSGRPGVKMDDD